MCPPMHKHILPLHMLLLLLLLLVCCCFPQMLSNLFLPPLHTQAHGAPVPPIASGHGHSQPPSQATERYVKLLFIGVNRLLCVLPGPLTNAIRRPPRLVLPQALRAVQGKTRALPTSIAPESGVHAVSTVRGIGRSLRRNRVTVIFARMSRRVIMGTTYALTRTLTAQALYVHSVTHIHSYTVTQSLIFQSFTFTV